MKDLYIVFNGLYLFNWKKDGPLEVYIPDVNVHQPLLATQADLTANVSLTKGTLKIPELAGFVASSKKGKFDKKDNLVIDGSVYDINQAAQPYAKLELPWPDETFSASVSWVHKYAYVGKTDPNATLSVTEPSKVNDGSGNPKDAIAVSEVFVLKYTQAVESASFPVDGGVVPAIEYDSSLAFVLLSLVKEEHLRHPHDGPFNQLLVDKAGRISPDYHPTATYKQLDMDAYYPKSTTSVPPLPCDWLKPMAIETVNGGVVVKSVSGMGSCDGGHRCEEC